MATPKPHKVPRHPMIRDMFIVIGSIPAAFLIPFLLTLYVLTVTA